MICRVLYYHIATSAHLKLLRFLHVLRQNVNTLVFPNLSSANTAYKLIQEMSPAEMIGPIQMGLNKPIHFTDIESSVRDIVNITIMAVIDAIVQEKISK